MFGMGKKHLPESPPPEGIDLNFGKKLARIRKQRGFTQTDLAEKLGTVQAMVSAYENGKLRLNAEMIVRMAQALGVGTDELLGFHATNEEGSQEEKKQKLRIFKRLKQIEALPISKQKAVLQTLDMVLKANEG